MSYNANLKLYYYDEIGGLSYAGYSSNTAYGLVKFVAGEDLSIKKLASWTVSANTTLTFEVYDSFSGGALNGLLGTISNKACDYAGYHTFALATPISVSKGDDFYVKVKYYTPGWNYPVPFEKSINYYALATIESGVSWMSSNGSYWTALGSNTSNPWDLCIRAYTENSLIIVEKPVLTSPANNSTGNSLSPMLNWNDCITSDSYSETLLANSDYSNPVINTATASSDYQISSGLLSYGTKYYWRVKNNVNGESSDWVGNSFTTKTLSLGTPSLVSPKNRASGVSLPPTLDWTNVTDATCYEIQIYSDKRLKNLIYNGTSTSSQKTLASGDLKANYSYYWQVRATAGSLKGSWTGTWKFSTGSSDNSGSGVTLTAPVLTSPINGETSVPTNAYLAWKTVTGAETYSLQVSDKSNFRKIIYSASNITATSHTVPDGKLSTSSTYYWRAQAKAGSQTSSWSSKYKFATVASNGSDGLALVPGSENSAVSVYPNPANDKITIKADFGEQSNVIIKIVNILGSEIRTLSAYDTKNIYEIMDISELARGIYIISLKVNGEVYYQNLIVQ